MHSVKFSRATRRKNIIIITHPNICKVSPIAKVCTCSFRACTIRRLWHSAMTRRCWWYLSSDKPRTYHQQVVRPDYKRNCRAIRASLLLLRMNGDLSANLHLKGRKNAYSYHAESFCNVIYSLVRIKSDKLSLWRYFSRIDNSSAYNTFFISWM